MNVEQYFGQETSDFVKYYLIATSKFVYILEIR